MRIYLLVMMAAVLIWTGCGGPFRRGGDDRPSINYEVAWVDPQIIVSDSLYTLIRAERIDSFVVDRPVRAGGPTVAFEVNTLGCKVAINLHESGGAFLQPILVEQLPPGFYKLTLNPTLYDSELLPGGKYSIRADVCGREARSSFWKN